MSKNSPSLTNFPLVAAKSRGEPLLVISCLRPVIQPRLPNLNEPHALCVQILDTTTPHNNARQQPCYRHASVISTI
jgi:hypothetical protein